MRRDVTTENIPPYAALTALPERRGIMLVIFGMCVRLIDGMITETFTVPCVCGCRSVACTFRGSKMEMLLLLQKMLVLNIQERIVNYVVWLKNKFPELDEIAGKTLNIQTTPAWGMKQKINCFKKKLKNVQDAVQIEQPVFLPIVLENL